MNETNLLLSQNEKFKFVGVVFNGGDKVYHYKTVLDIDVDDKILVPAGDGREQVIKMVTVVSVGDLTSVSDQYKYKWVVQKVDMSHFKECIEVENTLIKQLNSLRTNRIRKEYLEHLETQIGGDGLKLLGDSIDALGESNGER